MQITPSARRHGIATLDIQHAWQNALRYVEYEYGGDERLLIIGPDRAGNLLELVAVPARHTYPSHPLRSAPAEVLRLLEVNP